MKKWHIYGIIGVLTLALMGLAYVQSIYIKRGLVIQNQIFNQYVNDALVRVAVKIEEEAAFKMLNRPRLEKIYDKVQSSNGSCGIRLQYQNGLILLDVEKENESFWSKALSHLRINLTTPDTQIKKIPELLSKQKIREKIEAAWKEIQLPIDYKKKKSQFVIKNDCDCFYFNMTVLFCN